MTNHNNTWYQIEDIEEIDSPALVIYLERVKQNIDLAISMIGDASRLRPHVKTHKTKEITLLMMKAGITKFKCATIAEAEMLGMCSAPDVLLAYQPTGPKLTRFISLIKKYPTTNFSCLVDNAVSAMLFSKNSMNNNIQVNVFIDLNVGQNRTGIITENSLKLFDECRLLKGINIIGLHAYDGHIYDTDLQVRKQKADTVFEKVEAVKNQLISKGSNPVIVIGGSPTFPVYAKKQGVECSPGTFVYWDKGYGDLFSEMKFLPSALVVSRVISVLDETKVCLDLGHKSIAAENDLFHRVSFLDEPNLTLISQNEEHLVVEFPSVHTKKTGDVLYGIPVHVCPTCALYESAYVIENRKVKEQWKIIGRDRRITV